MDSSHRVTLETQVLRLYELMDKMRADLSVLTDTKDNKRVLDSAAGELMSVAQESEKASGVVLDANKKIAKTAEDMVREAKFKGARQVFKGIVDACAQIELACEAQETARARIADVVKTINLVEGTLNALVMRMGGGSAPDVNDTLSSINMMDAAVRETNRNLPVSGTSE